jgi:hypothetical protein
MIFAVTFLQPETILLENPFNFFDCSILRDDSVFIYHNVHLKLPENNKITH